MGWRTKKAVMVCMCVAVRMAQVVLIKNSTMEKLRRELIHAATRGNCMLNQIPCSIAELMSRLGEETKEKSLEAMNADVAHRQVITCSATNTQTTMLAWLIQKWKRLIIRKSHIGNKETRRT